MTSSPTPKRSFAPAAGILVLGLALPATLPAADTPPRIAPPPAPQEAIVLSPFEVVAEDDGSYLATNTLAGTRFNTELKDVPASLSVMTADFLRDINANNIGEAMEYTIGAEFDQEATTGNNLQSSDIQMRMRGFRNSTLGRNFFEVNTAQDSYNMERATFSRGPNSVLFGSGGAGGIADATTKRAQRNPITRFANRLAPFDNYRFEADLNRPVSKTLALRLNTLYWTRKGWRDFEFMDRRSAALAATWKPFSRTTVRIDAEYGKVDELRPQPWAMLDNVSPWINAGRPISNTFGAIVAGTGTTNSTAPVFISNSNEIVSVRGSRVTTSARASSGLGLTSFKDQSVAPFTQYVAGPGATTNNDFVNAGAFIEQQIFPDLVVEAAANHQRNTRDWNKVMNWNQMTAFADTNAFRPDGTRNPYVGQYYVENSTGVAVSHLDQTWNDYRVTASYKFDLGKFGAHQIAGMVSRRDTINESGSEQEAWANNPANPNLTAAANNVVRRTYVAFYGPNSLGLPSNFQNPFTTPVNVNGIATRFYNSGMSDTLSRYDSLVSVLQSRFFEGRLITTLGARRDEQTSWGNTLRRDPITQEVLAAIRDPNSTSLSGSTRTAGVVLHVQPWLSLAANTSDNATPQNYLAFGLDSEQTNTPLGIRKGDGRDFGARFTLFDRRIHGSVTYYETNEQNSQRFKLGNANSGWELFFKQAYTALGKPFASITGEDTVDIVSHGWETEWVVNVNRNLRVMVNGSRSTVIGSNQFPRVTAFAEALLPELRAQPSLPITGVSGSPTAGALADRMEGQIAIDHRTEGRLVQNARPYSGNIFVNYRFTEGRLKGLAASVGINARGRRVIGYNTVTLQPVMDGDYTQVNPSLSYSRPIHIGQRKVEWNVVLAGTNVFGKRYGLLPIAGDEVGIDRFAFETTPSVSLTNRFSF